MKIEINLASFRLKIILTLILVIASVSFISLFFFNHTLSKKIYKNAERDIESFLYFFRDQVISIHDGRTIRPSLEELVKSDAVMDAYMVNPQGEIIFPPNTRSVGIDTMDFQGLALKKEDITLHDINQGNLHFSRASIRFSNSPACYSCHSPDQEILGFIVLDFSMHDYENTVTYTRNFSFIFTFIMVCLIVIFVMIMHFKFIKKSLSDFKATINVINNGDLHGRVKIPESKELGELGTSFNTMVDHLQIAREELERYHREELKNKQKLASIGEMSARLAHEIRNPITGIANAIEIIIDETEDNQYKPVLEEIRRQANRVNKAISNLLNYSRTKDLNLQDGDINEIIRSVVFFLNNQVHQKKIIFKINLGDNIPVFKFDPEQIENVLLNLGMNAVQTVETEGVIELRSYYIPQSGKVGISVTDDGKGVPPDKIADIFHPFFTMRTEGTGLGLAIAKEIVEMHNGEIRVENNPDKGCTFYISIPISQVI
jgi:two-component system, NtrC family, sensor kinase